MSRSISVDEAISILTSGDFAKLEGVIEDTQIEFKATPYQLDQESAKHELAKDVSALANSHGGIILIGFRTNKDRSAAVEYVDECREFESHFNRPREAQESARRLAMSQSASCRNSLLPFLIAPVTRCHGDNRAAFRLRSETLHSHSHC